MTIPQPGTIPSQYVVDLRVLAHSALQDAQDSLARLADEVSHAQTPNVHRYELLAQRQYLAAFAFRVAAALEEPHSGSTPIEVAEGVRDAFLVQHSTGRDDLPGRAIRQACSRVIAAVAAVQVEDEERLRAEAEEQFAIEAYNAERGHDA